MITVTDFTDGGAALGVHETSLSGRHFDLRVSIIVKRNEDDGGAGSTSDLSSLTWQQLHAVDFGGRRN